MDQIGTVHEKLDVKILILYILRRLPSAIEADGLVELCRDCGIGYFDYTDCLNELIESGHIEEDAEGYRITAKGAHNADAVESSLPYSIRARSARLVRPVAERLARAALITARHTVDEKGCTVELALNDGEGEVLRLQLLCGGEEQAKGIEKRFRRRAEDYYRRIMELMEEN